MEDKKEIELVDLGNALEETKQCTPGGIYWDSWFGYGSVEYHPGPYPQC